MQLYRWIWTHICAIPRVEMCTTALTNTYAAGCNTFQYNERNCIAKITILECISRSTTSPLLTTGCCLQAMGMSSRPQWTQQPVKTIVYYVMHCYVNCLNPAQYTQMSNQVLYFTVGERSLQLCFYISYTGVVKLQASSTRLIPSTCITLKIKNSIFSC